MSLFNIKIADLLIGISALNDSTRNWFTKYLALTDQKADFTISVNAEVVSEEKKIYQQLSQEDDNLSYVPDEATFEFNAILRQIAMKLPSYDGFVFHGSVVSVDNFAYMFTAVSGGGKSTHVALWKRLLGEKAVVVNDDKPILRLINDTVYAYGTPWCGKHNLNTNCRMPLKAICIVEKAVNNSIEEIEIDDVSGILLQQCYRPDNSTDMIRTIRLLDKFGEHIRFYRMKCNMDISAAEMSYEYMSSKV